MPKIDIMKAVQQQDPKDLTFYFEDSSNETWLALQQMGAFPFLNIFFFPQRGDLTPEARNKFIECCFPAFFSPNPQPTTEEATTHENACRFT